MCAYAVACHTLAIAPFIHNKIYKASCISKQFAIGAFPRNTEFYFAKVLCFLFSQYGGELFSQGLSRHLYDIPTWADDLQDCVTELFSLKRHFTKLKFSY